MTSDRLPPRIAAIRRAIETRLDFSVLAHDGEEEVVRYYSAQGVNGRKMILEWQRAGFAAQQQAKAVGVGRHSAVSRPARVETDLRSTDSDFWATDDIEPDDDDPGDDMPVCRACGGSGKDRNGNECQICHGRGRIPAEDQDDDDEEIESRKYEYQIEDE